MLTIKDHARNALTLATYVPSNASGVVFKFADWMRLACEMQLDRTELNIHPITRAYLIGLVTLVGNHQDESEYADILTGLEAIIASKEIEGL
jgi:hypothetical protein